MKSFISMDKRQKKMLHDFIKAEMNEYLDIRKDYLIFRLMGIMSTVFNEQYGFGRKRLSELVYLLGENFKQLDSWNDDADDLLILNLRRIHMEELADALQNIVEKVRESEKQ